MDKRNWDEEERIHSLGLMTHARMHIVFYSRRCFIMIYQAMRWRKGGPLSSQGLDRENASHNGNVVRGGSSIRDDGDDISGEEHGSLLHSEARRQLMSLNSELGISLHGDPSPEVILRDLDPQSMILCGLNKTSETRASNSTSSRS